MIKRFLELLLPIFLVSLICTEVSIATTYTVCTSGPPTCDSATVQGGVNLAHVGDTVLISAGTYNETVSTHANGTSDARIVIDGQNSNTTTVRQFSVNHGYYTIQNIKLTGTPVGSHWVEFNHGAHYTLFQNNVIDGNSADAYALWWEMPTSNFPWGSGEVASHCIITNNEIKNTRHMPVIFLGGEYNTFSNNNFHDVQRVEAWMRFGGRYHRITQNIFANNIHTPWTDGHPDSFETISGYLPDTGCMGAYNIVFDRNFVYNSSGDAQNLMLDLKADPDVTNLYFLNNIFVQAGTYDSLMAPNTYFFNNTFYNHLDPDRGGVGRSFGCREYTFDSCVGSRGYLISGTITEVVLDSSVTIQSGTSYWIRVYFASPGYYISKQVDEAATTGGSYPWTGTLIKLAEAFDTPPSVGAFYGFVKQATICADGSKMYNNILLDGGTGLTADPNKTGYYFFNPTTLIGVAADYNYVAKELGGVPYSAMAEDSLHRAIGDPGGWDNWLWWEPNGMNGGNPYLVNAFHGCTHLTCDLRLTDSTPAKIKDGGKDLTSLWPAWIPITDYAGNPRPSGSGWSIGAFEYTGTPISFDWRNVGGVNYISDVRNQNLPGQDFATCLVHSVIAALEAKAVINGVISRELADFSEQVINSCCYIPLTDPKIEENDCGGHDWGNKPKMLEWIRDYGVPLESCAPYVGWDEFEGYGCFPPYVCSSYLSNVYKISSYTAVNGTVTDLKNAVYNYGPVMVEMNVCSDFDSFFITNPDGVYSYTSGNCGAHAVLIIGYNDSGNYFICKNSRGTILGGNQGFFKIAYSQVGASPVYFGNSAYYLGTVSSYSGAIPTKVQGVTIE